MGYVRRDYAELLSSNDLGAALARSGLSRRKLASDVGLRSHGFIGHLLAGRRLSCTPELARRIAAALGVPAESLFLFVGATQDGAASHPEWNDDAA